MRSAQAIPVLIGVGLCALAAVAPTTAETEVTRRTVDEALPWLEAIARRPFRELVAAYDLRFDVASKGAAGMLLEELLGLSPDNRRRDFLDAELKTNKTAPDGTPLETMFITQLGRHVDYLLQGQPYADSWLAEKIERVVFLPVVKEGPPGDWYFLACYDVYTGPGSPYFEQLEEDYRAICRQLREQVEREGRIRTASGRYIQVRTKDRKPYTPILSAHYGTQVSDKGYAFYFRKPFMESVRDRARAERGQASGDGAPPPRLKKTARE